MKEEPNNELYTGEVIVRAAKNNKEALLLLSINILLVAGILISWLISEKIDELFNMLKK